MKRIIFISIIVLLAYGTSVSQSIWALSYEPSTPLGDTRNFIEKSSLRGLSGSTNWFINDNLTLGLDIQWTGFYEKKERETWEIEGGAVTANAWKEFYIWSFYANTKYHFMSEEESRVIPYVGLGIGLSYVDQSLQIGTYEEDVKKAKFALAPEAGAMFPMGIEKTWGLNLKLRYQMLIYNENIVDLLQYLNYSFGVYWKILPRGERY